MEGRRNISLDGICRVCHRKYIQGLSNPVQKWHPQHLKGYKICSLSVFLILFYLITTAILL